MEEMSLTYYNEDDRTSGRESYWICGRTGIGRLADAYRELDK
jgi:hypothetical protein